MMNNKARLHDVFLAFANADAGIAEVVRRDFEARGLGVLCVGAPTPDQNQLDGIRDALAESRAFVMILTRSFLNSTWMAFFLGAASSWDKPIYILLENLTFSEVPAYLRTLQVRPFGKRAEVIEAIARVSIPLPETKLDLLTELYSRRGIPTDNLAADPDSLDALTDEFNQASELMLTPDHVFRELARLRKLGRLRKLHAR